MTTQLRLHADYLDVVIADFEDRLMALELASHNHTDPPIDPPPFPGMLVGLFTDDAGHRAGDWDIVRHYISGGIPSVVPTEVRFVLEMGDVLHLSAKPNVPMGPMEQDTLRDLFADAESLGGELWISLWHEPENDNFTAQAWGELQDQLVDIASEYHFIKPIFNLMGWGLHSSQQGGSNLQYLDAIEGLQGQGIVAIDVYDWPSSKGRPSEDLLDAYTAETVGEIQRRGWSWMIAETGTVGNDAHQEAWILRNMQAAFDAGCVAWEYFAKDKPNEPDNRMWDVSSSTLVAMRAWRP